MSSFLDLSEDTAMTIVRDAFLSVNHMNMEEVEV